MHHAYTAKLYSKSVKILVLIHLSSSAHTATSHASRTLPGLLMFLIANI